MSSDTSIIIALAHKLEAENDRLKAENAQLRRERDDARAQGIVTLNEIHHQRMAIKRLAIKRLEEERDQLRAGQGRWPEDGPGPHMGFYKSEEDAPTSDNDKDSAPRLTVHALNTAPVGSYVSVQGEIAEKLSNGNWVGRGHFYSPAEIVSHPGSTLHLGARRR